jgi:hypothetical protein
MIDRAETVVQRGRYPAAPKAVGKRLSERRGLRVANPGRSISLEDV